MPIKGLIAGDVIRACGNQCYEQQVRLVCYACQLISDERNQTFIADFHFISYLIASINNPVNMLLGLRMDGDIQRGC